MPNLLEIFLARFIKEGALEVDFASGRTQRFGPDPMPEPPRIQFRDRASELRLLRNPELYLGELYMEGAITVTRGSLYEVIEVASRNAMRPDTPKWLQLLYKLRVALRAGFGKTTIPCRPDATSRIITISAISFTRCSSMKTCNIPAPISSMPAVPRRGALAKKRHIASKLRLEPGNRVLDIGCGWGGMALYLARTAGADVEGITLSEEQLAFAKRRATAAGMANHARFRLQDYREVSERYDRIVSVGMFEHVGAAYYRAFFEKLASILSDDGVALLHTIGRADVPGATNPWVRKYIFPGGYIPSLSEILPRIEETRLIVTDVEVLRLHYAHTLRAWRERFLARRDEAEKLYDERFCRMWEFYLCSSECAMRYERHVVYQIQIAKRLDKLPLTRDYLKHAEDEFRATDQRRTSLSLAGE